MLLAFIRLCSLPWKKVFFNTPLYSSFMHTVLLIKSQGEAEPQLGVGFLSQASCFLTLPRLPSVLCLKTLTTSSCALLTQVKIYLLDVNILLKCIFTPLSKSIALIQYWVKSTFIGQQFYMPINTWLHRKIIYVIRWTYKIDKDWVVIWIAKEPFTLFKYFFKTNNNVFTFELWERLCRCLSLTLSHLAPLDIPVDQVGVVTIIYMLCG